MGLMEDSCQFSALSSKYENFQVPAAKLKVGGKDILDSKNISVGKHTGQIVFKCSQQRFLYHERLLRL